MEAKFVLLAGFFLSLLLIDCSGADSEVEESAKLGFNPKAPQTPIEPPEILKEKTGASNTLPDSNIVEDVPVNMSKNAGESKLDRKSETSEDRKDEKGNAAGLDEESKGKEIDVEGRKELKVKDTDGEKGNVPGLGEEPNGKDSEERKGNKARSGEGLKGKGSKEEKENAVGPGEKLKGNGSNEEKPNEAGLGNESKGKDGDVARQNLSDGEKSKEETRNTANEGDAASSVPTRKEGSWGENCDSSKKCTDEENNLVACLRVPGNESPDLSLLIQNKGKRSLKVSIAAPEYVQLEQTEVQLKEKEYKKVKVSIGNEGNGGLIVLTAGNGRCSLDYGDLIAHNAGKELDSSRNSSYISYPTQIPVMAIIAFAGILAMAFTWMCVSFQRKHHSDMLKYQRLDMELPVSNGGRSASEVKDGWDNSWDDNWDDEEAPNTPSMPVTPSLSSKGLASRRLNKEGWKD